MIVDHDEQTGTVYFYPNVMEDYHPKPTDEEMANASEPNGTQKHNKDYGAVNLADFEVSSEEDGAAPPGTHDNYNGFQNTKFNNNNESSSEEGF